MPFISDNQLAQISAHVERAEDKVRSRTIAEKLKTAEMIAVGESAVGAAVVGYARGRYAKEGRFDVPRTTIPADFLAAAVVLGTGYFGKDKGGHLLALGTGALAGSTAMYFQRHGAAAKAAGKFWAGDPQEIVGRTDIAGLPDIVGDDEMGRDFYRTWFRSWAQRNRQRGHRWAGAMDDEKLAAALQADPV